MSEVSLAFFNERAEKEFFQSLGETIAWCQEIASSSDPKTSLRQLAYVHQLDLLSERRHRVRELVDERSRELGRLFPDKAKAEFKGLAGGRLLVFPPDDSLSDGCAEMVSDGFFDVDNCPPSDTWVCLWEGTRPKRGWRNTLLISWVPPIFITNAQAGIDVNPEECMFWLDDLDHPIVTELRNRGVLP